MHPLTLAHELSKESNRVERLAGRVGLNPHLLEQLKFRQERIVNMQTSFDEMQDEQLQKGKTIQATKPNRTLKPPKGQPTGDHLNG